MLRPIATPSGAQGPLQQIEIPTVGTEWFDPRELTHETERQHGVDGETCPECGVWKWSPLVPGILPPLRIAPALVDQPFAASPEWFGDGRKAFRQVLVRSDIARLIAVTSPRDFEFVDTQQRP